MTQTEQSSETAIVVQQQNGSSDQVVDQQQQQLTLFTLQNENNNENNHKNNNKKKRKRRKKKIIYSESALAAMAASQSSTTTMNNNNTRAPSSSSLFKNVQVEYVSPHVIDETNPHYKEFARIFGRFASAEQLMMSASDEKQASTADDTHTTIKKEEDQDGNHHHDETSAMNEQVSDDDNADQKTLSKKQQKRSKQIDIAELKRTTKRPDVVEIHDTTAQDPKLLVHLKSYFNTVPVPRHWSQKRKYLQGKRGIEKQPFKLPDFIRDTGIQQVRDAYMEKEEEKKSKQKARERTRPKMGVIDIDYAILRDAFFKHQTKPKMTIIGDTYYEGKEFHAKKTTQDYKPGFMSERLKAALGMPPGAPPPWLVNMQKAGMPPSYPKLRIPGLNAPIPEGAAFGFHPGGWGKLPTDMNGKPLYNDYFNTEMNSEMERERTDDAIRAANVKHWGQLEHLEEEEEEEEDVEYEEEEQEEEEEKEEKQHVPTVVIPPVVSRQLPPPPPIRPGVPPTGLPKPPPPPTRPVGIPTPEQINLRKAEPPRALYQVLEQQQTNVAATDLMGSSHRYIIPSNQTQQAGVAISINPDQLDNVNEQTILQKVEVAPETRQAFTLVGKTPQELEEESKKRKREKEKSKQKKKKIKF